VESGEIPISQQVQPSPAQTLPVSPPPVIIYRESRSTSPPAQPEYATVSVGPDEVTPVFTLPSGVSLNLVVKAVRKHRGYNLDNITDSDR